MTTAVVAKKTLRKTNFYILAPLFMASILAFLDRVNVSYAELKMSVDLVFDAKIYGFGAGIFFAGYVIFEVPGAILAEKWSPSRWIARIMLSWGFVCILLAFMTEAWHFYVLRFLLGACEASLYPVVYACVIPRWFTQKNRARAISLTLTSLLVSAIIGGPLAGTLVSFEPFGYHGWQVLFILEGAITMIYGLFILRWLKDDPSEVTWLTDEEKQYLISTIEEENKTKAAKVHYSIKQALANPRVLRLCLIYFLWMIGFWGFNFWLPRVIMAASNNWSPMVIGWVSIIPMIAALIMMVVIGNSSSRRAESRNHVGFMLFTAFIGYMLLGITWGMRIEYSMIALTIVGMGVYSSIGVWWSIPTTFLTGAAAAGATGLINSVGNIGGFIGPYMVGFIQSSTGELSPSFYIMGGSLLLSSLMVLTLKKEKYR